jgi:predicted nucleotidyltransferase
MRIFVLPIVVLLGAACRAASPSPSVQAAAPDVDVLVEFQPGHVPGLDFVSMEREFSRLLQGRCVDIVTPKFLNARIRDQVLKSAEPLHVAA